MNEQRPFTEEEWLAAAEAAYETYEETPDAVAQQPIEESPVTEAEPSPAPVEEATATLEESAEESTEEPADPPAQAKKSTLGVALGVVCGLILGAVVGFLVQSVPVCVVGGVLAGVLVGLLYDLAKDKPQTSAEEQEYQPEEEIRHDSQEELALDHLIDTQEPEQESDEQ